jgi:tripartite-type tricarboxylate transporter receptor subunit TctC
MKRRLTVAFAIAAASFIAILIAVLILFPWAPARAENFPEHPIKVVSAWAAGGPSDTMARLATRGLDRELGQNVFVENLPGAGGRIGARDVARAPADGYTLLLGGTNDNAVTPALYKNLDYDPVKDFVPIAAVADDPQVMVINPAVPVHTLAELVQYAKAHPGQLSSGASTGIAPHLLLEYFRVRTGTDIVFVPYNGAAPAIADLLGNHIQINVTTKAVLLPHILAGRLRALAVTTAARWPELPDVPTFRESGFDGFPDYLRFGLFAPKGTPPDIIAKINAAENARLKSPDMQDAIAKLGLESHPMSPQAFGAVMEEQVRLWQSFAREANLKLD